MKNTISSSIRLSFLFLFTFMILSSKSIEGSANSNLSTKLSNTVTNNKENDLKRKTYTITTKTEPYIREFLKYHNYNSNTKHYYLIRSYLETLEKNGGGTLVLKKGTYTVTNTLYVPSNVTIILSDGVIIKKGSKTSVSDMPASTSLFQLVRPSKANSEGVYGKYNGEDKINFIGKGSATIDMGYFKDGIAIIMGHNDTIKVENISFKNMQSGHFLEIDASKNVVISGCEFTDSKSSGFGNKEAINLDTPDHITKGWHQDWSKYDKTANINVTIEDCTFKNLERAIGTHQYSDGKYHTNIIIKNNTIENTNVGIFTLNWKDPIIEGNLIKDCLTHDEKYSGYPIYICGTQNPTIKNNLLTNCSAPITFFPGKGYQVGQQYYKPTYSTLTIDNVNDLKTNKVDSFYINSQRTIKLSVFDYPTIELGTYESK